MMHIAARCLPFRKWKLAVVPAACLLLQAFAPHASVSASAVEAPAVMDEATDEAQIARQWAATSAPAGFCATLPSAQQPRLFTTRLAPAALLPPADSNPDPTEVDILLLYTAQAALAAGGEDVIRAQILANLEDANRRFSNSRIHVHLNPVFAGQIDYTESGDMGLDGQRLMNGTDGLQKAITLRNDYKADITLLVVDQENNGVGGLAESIPPPTAGEPDRSVCLLRRLHLRFPLVMAHEIGHLLGCDHSRDNASLPLNDPFYTTRFPYIFGHRFTVEGVRYADTMTYPPAVHLPIFSNPNLSLDGVPTGAADSDPEPSDTARTINQIAPYVAKYREAQSRVEFETPQIEALPGDTTAVFKIKRSGSLAFASRIFVTVDARTTAISGVDYTRPASLSIVLPVDQTEFQIQFALPPNPNRTTAKRVVLNMASPVGSLGIGWNGTATLTLPQTAGDPPADDELPSLESARILANPGKDLHPDAGLNVLSRGDGKLLVFGHFSKIAGRSQNGVALINLDGSLDESFRPPEILIGHRAIDGLLNPFINAVQPLADGSVLIGGLFSRVAGEPRLHLAKLGPDGSLDRSFAGTAFDGPVFSLALQHDGKILAGGFFKNAGGEPFSALVRLDAQGSIDHSFHPAITKSSGPGVHAILPLPDGKIVIGGAFDLVDSKSSTNLARLNPDGSLDATFKINRGASSAVHRLALQPDGRILAAGRFLSMQSRSSARIARLNPDGSFDATFKSPLPNGDVKDLVPLPDGRLVISGFFTKLGGASARFVAVLKSNGALDSLPILSLGPDDLPGNEVTYAFGDEATGRALGIAPDGSLLVAGAFQHFNGAAAPSLVRLDIGSVRPMMRLAREGLNNGPLLTVHGQSGGRYQIQSSEDLKEWLDGEIISLPPYQSAGSFPLQDFSTFQRRFMRLVNKP